MCLARDPALVALSGNQGHPTVRTRSDDRSDDRAR